MTNIILPTYTTKLPSTGKTVTFRPFTVKEEKALLLALEENNLETVAAAIKNTIKICTQNEINPDNHPYYDLEYLFLQIRAKSVGEFIDLIGSCDCTTPSTKTNFSVDITSPTVDGTCLSAKIKIPDTQYTITIRHPTLSDFVASIKNESESGTETIASCITSVYTDEEVYDWNLKEKTNFVESMSPKQQVGIAKFLDAMPTIKIDASFKCNKCGQIHEQTLSGFENFFV